MIPSLLCDIYMSNEFEKKKNNIMLLFAFSIFNFHYSHTLTPSQVVLCAIAYGVVLVQTTVATVIELFYFSFCAHYFRPFTYALTALQSQGGEKGALLFCCLSHNLL